MGSPLLDETRATIITCMTLYMLPVEKIVSDGIKLSQVN